MFGGGGDAEDYVSGDELRGGESVEIEFGNYGNFVLCTVADVRRGSYGLGEFLRVSAVRRCGRSLEFCLYKGASVRRVKVGCL